MSHMFYICSGGLIAALASGIYQDHILHNAIRDVFNEAHSHILAHRILPQLFNYYNVEVEEPPFKFAIMACSGTSLFSKEFMSITCSIHGTKTDTKHLEDEISKIEVRSLHLIGLDDPLKPQGESLCIL